MTDTNHPYKVLVDLVNPLEWNKFFSDFYEQKPCYFPHNSSENFANLISLERLDHLLATSELPPASIDMARSKPPISRDHFTFKSGNIDRGAVIRHYQNGATIIFPQLNLAVEELANFCRAFEHEFSCKVQTNVYLTPQNSQGFKTHYDDHDVFIIQMHGSKRWRVYQKAVDKPFRGEPFKASEHSAGDLDLSFTMKPGDCVYIPRGYMHDAVNVGEEPSLHITVGLLVKKWADLMLEVLSEVAINNSKFRESLPAGFAAKDFDANIARAHFDELMKIFASEADFENVFELFKQEFYRTRKPNLKGALVHSSIASEARGLYRLRDNFQATMQIESDKVVISCGGGDLRFDSEFEEVLETILQGKSFDFGLLKDLPAEKAEDLLKKLVAFGVISTIDNTL